MRVLIIVLILLGAPFAVASPGSHTEGAITLAAGSDFMRPKPQGMLPSQEAPPKIGNQQAASMVKSAYADHKILSVQLIEAKGPPVYRIKTLSEDGVVKYVYVDGNSGDIFE